MTTFPPPHGRSPNTFFHNLFCAEWQTFKSYVIENMRTRFTRPVKQALIFTIHIFQTVVFFFGGRFMKTCIEIQFQLNFRNELKRISKQHPSSSNSDIMKIASSNLKLNVNEDGSHRPCEYAVSLGINEGKERRMIYKHKKNRKFLPIKCHRKSWSSNISKMTIW